MTRVGITGHRDLGANTAALVDAAVRQTLYPMAGAGLIGVTCLADGADTVFAQAVLDLGGTIEVIVPAVKYRDSLPAEHHAGYDRLLASASHVHQLDHQESDPAAHMAASVLMIGMVSQLVAVWDGKPARGYGGTADVVAEANKNGVAVTTLWPAGATRG
jgi:hypothetical protein